MMPCKLAHLTTAWERDKRTFHEWHLLAGTTG
jgi:hypothetical protein